MGAIYIRDSKPNGSDFRSALQVRSSDPFRHQSTQIFKWAKRRPKYTRAPRGRIFEFKPNGSEFWIV